MKLYRTSGWDNKGGTGLIYAWDGTQADARARRKELAGNGLDTVETEDIDVPTDKPSLLLWLNANCNSGNG